MLEFVLADASIFGQFFLFMAIDYSRRVSSIVTIERYIKDE